MHWFTTIRKIFHQFWSPHRNSNHLADTQRIAGFTWNTISLFGALPEPIWDYWRLVSRCLAAHSPSRRDYMLSTLHPASSSSSVTNLSVPTTNGWVKFKNGFLTIHDLRQIMQICGRFCTPSRPENVLDDFETSETLLTYLWMIKRSETKLPEGPHRNLSNWYLIQNNCLPRWKCE